MTIFATFRKSKMISKQVGVVVVVVVVKRTAVTEVGSSRQLLDILDGDCWSICWSPCPDF